MILKTEHVAKYFKDCRLCNLLINKLDIITNNISMANVCSVIVFLFFRTRSKLFSLVAKKFRKDNYATPLSHETKYVIIKLYLGKILKDEDDKDHIEFLIKK